MSLWLYRGFLYLGIVGLILVTAVRYWHQARTGVALAIVGILFLMFGQWLNGGQYSIAFLIWFSIGALDRMYRRKHEKRLTLWKAVSEQPGAWSVR